MCEVSIGTTVSFHLQLQLIFLPEGQENTVAPQSKFCGRLGLGDNIFTTKAIVKTNL